jgi:hypothetical protein
MTVSQVVFGIATTLGLGLLVVGAPAGRFLVSAPPPEKTTHGPSLRAGSSHRTGWYFFGGGYHGGK